MFKRYSLLKLVAAAVSLAVVAGVAATAGAKPAAERLGPPSPAVIAMVDLPKVLDGIKARQAKDDELKAGEAALKKKADELKASLAAEMQVIEAMPNTEAKIASAKAFREKKLRADFDLDYGKALLTEQQADGLKDLYSQITTAVAQLAKTRGYHLVISSDESVPVRGNYEQATQTISLKRFLFVDPSMDVTDELVQFMNNQFATGAASPAPAAEPAPKK